MKVSENHDHLAGASRESISSRTAAWSVALALTAGVCIFSLNSLVQDGSILRSDGIAYFMYARSIVLDRDTDLTPEYPEVLARFPGSNPVTSSLLLYSHRVPETGKVVVPWPIGAGVVMAPFYAIGYAAEYVLAAVQHRPPDAYGVLPQYFFGLGSVLFGILAFWTALACCARLTNLQGATLATVSALLAGPAVFYIFFSPTMSHAVSLGLVGLVTWLWLRCWQDGSRRLFWLGLLIGTIACIRYQNAVFGLMVLALVARDARRFGLGKGLRESAVAGAGMLIPVSLQAAHYVAMNGASPGYRADGEFMVLNHIGINLTSPQISAVLFACNKGAFYWAPVMAVGFAGLVYAAWHHGWARVALATCVADVMLISFLRHYGDTFDLGVSFGMRYLTECSVAVAMGVAALIGKTPSPTARYSWIALGALLSVWNLLLIMAYVLTIPRSGCVTFPQMASGMVQAVTEVVALIGGR